MIDFAKHLKDRFQGKNLGEDGKAKRRSGKWRKVRKAHLKKYPRCAVCGSTKKIEVHHQIPFSIDPELELDELNLITLCENKRYGLNCHLLIGHLGSYRRFNPTVEVDAVTWKRKIGK